MSAADLDFIIRTVVVAVLFVAFLWLLLRLDNGDAELHEAARRERLRRQRDAWTSNDGRSVR